MSVINRSWSAGLYCRDRIRFSAEAAALARRMQTAASANRPRASSTFDKAKSMGARAVSARLGSAIRRSSSSRSWSEIWNLRGRASRRHRRGVGRVARDRPAEPAFGFVHIAKLFHEAAHSDLCIGQFGLQGECRFVLLPGLAVFALALKQPAQITVKVGRSGSTSIIFL